MPMAQSSIFNLIFWTNNFFLCGSNLCGNKFLTGTYLANIKRILAKACARERGINAHQSMLATLTKVYTHVATLPIGLYMSNIAIF